MKISTVRTDSTVIRGFVITDDTPVVPMTYSHPPKQVRIERGTIRYTWQDGAWKVKNAWAIKLTGPVLKKDGTDSKNEHTRNPANGYDQCVHDSGHEWIATEGWEWLADIVTALRPTGALTLPEHSGAEVTE